VEGNSFFFLFLFFVLFFSFFFFLFLMATEMNIFLSTHEGKMRTAAKCFECLFLQLGLPSEDEIDVWFEESDDGVLCLSLHPNETTSSTTTKPIPIRFGHSPVCPVRDYQKRGMIPHAIKTGKKTKVGVCVLIECSSPLDPNNSHVFLTQRTSLRIFPHFWVLPGGHWDAGETAVETAVREVKEETGLHLQPKDLRPLCLWESTYPICAEDGEPSNHHLVLFYHAKIMASLDSILFKLQKEEVHAAAWVCREDVITLLKRQESIEVKGTLATDSPQSQQQPLVILKDKIGLGHLLALRVWARM
jgi:8-oxo-dGTP pyrophosphatase MutT (NUDIX family)